MVTGEIAVDQHDVAILAALGLLDANDLLCAVDVLDLEPDYEPQPPLSRSDLVQWHYPEMSENAIYFRLPRRCGPQTDLPAD